MNESRFPLLSVNPIRVKAGEASGVLHEVQRDIGRALPFEFFSLSRLQLALRPGKALFEALFSLSIDEGLESSIWKTLKSAQPEADVCHHHQLPLTLMFTVSVVHYGC